MIRITEDSKNLADNSPFEHMNEKWREDKNLYRKICKIYDENFEKYLKNEKKPEYYEYYLKEFDSEFRKQSDIKRKLKELSKLKGKYDEVRPYVYRHKNDFYVLYKKEGLFTEANIFQLEQHEVVLLIENNLKQIPKILETGWGIIFNRDINEQKK